MLIPLRTDRNLRRRPVVTETLIITNGLVYLAGLAGAYFNLFEIESFVNAGSFDPQEFRVWQLFTYQFLHDPSGPLHIIFNMLFLWVFGSAVEDRMGRLGFLGFYLIGGAVAGLAHAQITAAPVIGASGSVAGVTGAFLALFPRSTIKVLLVFFIIGIYHIPSLWFVAFYFVIDVLRQTMDLLGGAGSNVAYMAHIAGYVYGFAMAFSLLTFRIVRHEDVDVFLLFAQARRRAAFRAAMAESKNAMWDSPARGGVEPSRGKSKPREMTPEEQAAAEERSEIGKLIANHDLPAAAKRYRAMLGRDPQAVFAEDRQLDLANQLAADGDHRTAAQAYELLLAHFPRSPKANEVRLILGMIYTRRLGNRERARELLQQAKPNLHDVKQSQFADQLLHEIEVR